ncbi:MAG TPA: transporter [Methylomirabilota bacterium]|nr:transporter [Methylomirabilota bacterium]
MRTAIMAVGLGFVAVTGGMAEAIDHKNLDEGRPVRLEDAYPIGHQEIAIEGGAGFALVNRGPNQGFFPIEVLYGALPNLQVGLSSTLFTNPSAIDDRPKSGDLRASGLYNFNQETLTLPAFAGKLSVTAPTGVDGHGWGIELKAIVTKSIDRLSFHFNGGYEFLTGSTRAERDGRYEFALGASYPVGAPTFTRATVVTDVFAEQPVIRGESTVVGIEGGLRYLLTPSIIWDVGVGTEFAGPAKRSVFFATTGFSFGF